MRYRYSKDIVYNNFIWPECGHAGRVTLPDANPVNPVNPVEKNISDAAQTILDIRKRYLDAERVAHLFNLYAEAVKAEKET